ncbi:hypothetical protein [Streptomyces niveus]|uniref:hypothetical protein n=1 Tax=Streptomyces niveus TaxID=193462 RepID=UPI00342F5C26
MRQRERTDVMRLKAFLREAMLPHTVEGRQVLEALGEADRLCNARIAGYSTGDVIVCVLEAGTPEGDTPLREEPEGRYRVQRGHPD